MKKVDLGALPEGYRMHPQFDPTAEFPDPRELLLQRGREKYVGTWLLLCAGGVFFMVVLGGYTRLTHSGNLAEKILSFDCCQAYR